VTSLPAELVTPRLRMRPLRAGDLDALHAVYAHPLVAPWIGPHTRADTERELRAAIDGPYGLYAVEDRATGRLLGDGGLQPFALRDPAEPELGYDLHPDAWGRGLATELATAWVELALGALGLPAVVAVVRPDHAASRRVLEKAGLVLAGPREAYGERLLEYRTERGAR
jgi:RimJ/RimL family protein N-acetyltransferase